MASSATAPVRPSLALAVLGMLDPIIETDEDRLLAMSASLLHYATVAAKSGKDDMARRYYLRAGVLADRATTWPCCGVSKRDYCAC